MDATNTELGATDETLFESLPGGPDVRRWFGFVPSFHDAALERLDLGNGSASLILRAFRMTDAVDAEGFFVCDRHALVTIRLAGVTGVTLHGDAGALLFGLVIRRMRSGGLEWRTTQGPAEGDFEVRWESTLGLEGGLYARSVSLALEAL